MVCVGDLVQRILRWGHGAPRHVLTQWLGEDVAQYTSTPPQAGWCSGRFRHVLREEPGGFRPMLFHVARAPLVNNERRRFSTRNGDGEPIGSE